MNTMNFELAQKQLVLNRAGTQRCARPAKPEPVHRPSVALILLATAVQVIAMAALLWTATGSVQ